MKKSKHQRVRLDCPSWLKGMARTLDIGGVFSPPSVLMPPALRDWLALAHDLKMVREDMYRVFDREGADPRTYR